MLHLLRLQLLRWCSDSSKWISTRVTRGCIVWGTVGYRHRNQRRYWDVKSLRNLPFVHMSIMWGASRWFLQYRHHRWVHRAFHRRSFAKRSTFKTNPGALESIFNPFRTSWNRFSPYSFWMGAPSKKFDGTKREEMVWEIGDWQASVQWPKDFHKRI